MSFSVIKDNTTDSLTGTAFGINNMAVVASGFVFQPLIGFFLKITHRANEINGITIYSTGSYQSALIVIPIIFTIGFIVAVFFIKEKPKLPRGI